jgi:hypothetical protein
MEITMKILLGLTVVFFLLGGGIQVRIGGNFNFSKSKDKEED